MLAVCGTKQAEGAIFNIFLSLVRISGPEMKTTEKCWKIGTKGNLAMFNMMKTKVIVGFYMCLKEYTPFIDFKTFSRMLINMVELK